MNLKSKKFIVMLLVSSLLVLSSDLYAKKRGAQLIIGKKDGLAIEGELITIKPNSLLLLDTEGKDVSVEIEEIKTIRIVKKSKARAGAGAGIIILGGGTALYVATVNEVDPEDEWKLVLFVGAIGAVVGLLVGGTIGAIMGTDKTIQIVGMTDPEIRYAMDKLRKKARIRDYK